MRTVRISDEVWEEIAERGRFGETEDDVLRRVFGVPLAQQLVGAPRGPEVSSALATRAASKRTGRGPNRSTNRQSAYVANGQLIVEYASGARKHWVLPARDNKPAIQGIRREAMASGRANDATEGQINAILKALTEAGYHVTK